MIPSESLPRAPGRGPPLVSSLRRENSHHTVAPADGDGADQRVWAGLPNVLRIGPASEPYGRVITPGAAVPHGHDERLTGSKGVSYLTCVCLTGVLNCAQRVDGVASIDISSNS